MAVADCSYGQSGGGIWELSGLSLGGTGESHAWVEWWAGSWFAFDPTNDVDVTDRHVVVGRGRDYDDVPPLRGVYAGPFTSELFVTVEITKEG